MPSILTLEGPKLLGFGTPRLSLLRMNGAIGDAIGGGVGCVGCSPPQFGDAASDVNALTKAITAYAAQIRAVNKAATYLGLFGGVVGAIAGSVISRRMSKRKYARLGGAAIGGLGLGFGAFYASRSIMTPDFALPLTTAQQLLLRDLAF